MYATIFSFLLVLLQLIVMIVVATCILTRSRFVIDLHDDHPAEKTQSIPNLVFGILAIYCIVSDVKMPGALVIVREPGPMVIRVK